MTLAETPRLLSRQLSQGRYRLTYKISGPPSAALVQTVSTEIEFILGEQPLVRYVGSYAEYFRLDGQGGLGELEPGVELHDVHELDLERDGWSQQRIRRLLASSGSLGRNEHYPSQGTLEVVCRKVFRLAEGEVVDTRPIYRTAGGAEFGFLSEGPQGPPSAHLELVGQPNSLLAPPALPAQLTCAGRGRFLATGQRATELFRFGFATLSASLDDGGGYRDS